MNDEFMQILKDDKQTNNFCKFELLVKKIGHRKRNKPIEIS